MIFLWIVKYIDYATIYLIFGISPPVTTVLLDAFLPYLAAHFVKFIPNEIESDYTSSLSSKIVCVIDATIHPTLKPSHNQHLHYNEHYSTHGMLTTFLVDYDANISAFATGILGKMHDANSGRHLELFMKILQGRFALGDPGYANVPYVVAGFKTNQLNSVAARTFDSITRTEQVVVEHVNQFVKSCKVLSKKVKFTHSRAKHILCVYIVCGWYNWMKKTFGKFSYN